MSFQMDRQAYLQNFGPTVGDRVRLADTELFIEVEQDFTTYGDEVKFGTGKVIRDGMGQSPISNALGAVDLVITNALILDWWGIVKADVGIKDGRIFKIGKAGNPYTQDNVDIIIGPGTEIIAAENNILTAGCIDSHVHLTCPQIISVAIAAGTTTIIGGGTGPTAASIETICTPGPWNLARLLRAADTFPVNLGLLGKGNSSQPQGLIEQVTAGAMGLKIHEGWGSTPSVIDHCLSVADQYDIPVALHADTNNESGFVERTIAAFKERTIHAYHAEGAGGGHAPDLIKICGLPNVLPSSTNPTRPYTINTCKEIPDMILIGHNLDHRIPEDVAAAESRVRPETIAAEDILQDLGAISMMSSDAHALGRVGEVVIRTWQTAHKMKLQRGSLPGDSAENDNIRAKRYVAKYTINPAITHGIADLVGSIEVGKLADLCLWRPAFFGVKPDQVIKGGIVAWSYMGDANASIPTPQPVQMQPMFGSCEGARYDISFTFVSQAALEQEIPSKLSLKKQAIAATGTRQLSKHDMKLNDALPHIEVDPETYEVRADGELLTCEPAKVVPMARRYFLF